MDQKVIDSLAKCYDPIQRFSNHTDVAQNCIHIQKKKKFVSADSF